MNEVIRVNARSWERIVSTFVAAKAEGDLEPVPLEITRGPPFLEKISLFASRTQRLFWIPTRNSTLVQCRVWFIKSVFKTLFLIFLKGKEFLFFSFVSSFLFWGFSLFSVDLLAVISFNLISFEVMVFFIDSVHFLLWPHLPRLLIRTSSGSSNSETMYESIQVSVNGDESPCDFNTLVALDIS